MPKNKGGIEDVQNSGFGTLSRGLGGIFSSATLRKLGKTRVGDPAPAAKKRNPAMNKSQVASSAVGLGYSMDKNGYFKKNGGPPPNPTKAKGK